MKYKKYLVENKDIPRTTQHRWRRRIRHVGVQGQQNAFVGVFQQNPALFDMPIKQMSDTLQQNQTSEEQNPVVTISPAETSSQVFADVDDIQHDLDTSDRSLQVFADVDDRHDGLDAPDRSLQQQVCKESILPHTTSIQHDEVEVDVQMLSCEEQTTSDYQEESSDHGSKDMQHGKDIRENEIMGKTPINGSHVPPLWTMSEYSEKALQEQKRKEHELLILALKLKHDLTDEALGDILKVINAVTGKQSVSTTKYNFYKNMNDYKDYILIKHFCSDCSMFMETKDESVSCKICGKQVEAKEHIKSGNFFIVLPLEVQLRNIIAQHSFSQLTFNNKDKLNAHFGDVCDGVLYQKTLKTFTPLNDCPNFSITFSCDGVPLFKSSSQSIWPVLCTLNELPPNLRSDHIMLTALWFGAKKPHMNIFLEPFVKECIDIHERGFDWVTSDGIHGTSKVYALILVSDSVARPLLQNFKQFNGEFGCSFCLQKGTLVERGQGKARVYPFEANMELRSQRQTLELVTRAVETGTPSAGVKGPSVLSLLPGFDIIEGCVPDYMHSVLLGVTRSITSLWCNSENHQSPWYIGRSISQIDQLLVNIKPPSNVSRTPRSLKERCYWKAHEWLMWLLYYSISVLKGILPDKYLNHWIKLASGIALLLSTSITSQQLLEAQDLLLQFVSEMEHLYGVSNVTYNVHLCLHLSKSVQNWGPLWAHSAFQFEAYNMELIAMVKSTQAVPIQICKVFWMKKALPLYVSQTLKNPSSECSAVIDHLLSGKQKQKHAVRCLGVTAFGPPKRKMMAHDDYIALHSVVDRVEKQPVDYYDRVFVNGVIIHSQAYHRSKKRNSSVVRIKPDNTFFSVKTFIVADVGNGSSCYAIGRFFEEGKHSFSASVQNPSHFHPVKKVLCHLTAIHASAIEHKCLFIPLEKHKCDYIMTFLNYYEVTV
ncbi:uncharacterized protein [Misgurnus anguillicaudatus]|uniref:uncharacterized protein isoform X2 n=1 Tax=Misgurnus anguillicaudatus TaxID=75329 RepID=UPI003CCF074B